ncbi:MAG: 2-oxoacid:acceptor oxidoreductase family protein [Deltaproteobacteria bacterium]|nr:2-oxoacid:acceptor oxidoreductase family protein [Deltaproteobacteria bacterium]
MEKYTEVRWHGRAQQGVVTAAKLLGETALREGKYVQAFPEFGPERMGAPVRAFNRLSTEPVRMHCQVKNPGIVIIVDPTLIGKGGGKGGGGKTSSGGPSKTAGGPSPLVEGTSKDTVFIVNTPRPPGEMRKELGIKDGEGKVYTVDASRISIEKIGRHLPNTPMLGALSKVAGTVELQSIIDNFRENYSKKFDAKVIEGNIEAIRKGFEEVKGE